MPTSKRTTKVRAPVGYRIKVISVDDDIYVRLFSVQNPKACIGYISLVPTYSNQDKVKWLETHSYLQNEFHNKGLGTILYARAIQWALDKGFRVRSSGSSSSMAQRVWSGKSIRKYVRIKASPRKYDYCPYVWYAYSKDNSCNTLKRR